MPFGRLERSDVGKPMSDINMTPLIDVMLVLLVIFIITAPLMSTSLRLDLPKAEGATASDAPDFITVALTAEGALFIGDERLEPATFARRLADVAHLDPDTEVQLRADQAVTYGKVAALIGVIQQAGLSRVGFVAEAPDRQGEKTRPAPK